MDYEIRTVLAGEWRGLKDLRLSALSDPVSRLAFGATYADEAAFPEATWRRRAAESTTFVGVDPDGRWVGMATVLLEDGPQTHVVGMYVRPEHRGTGLSERLLRSAVAWSWERPEIGRVRLWVVGENERALAFYTRLGFVKTGRSVPHPPDPALTGFEMELRRPR